MVPKAASSPDIAGRIVASALRDIVADGRRPLETAGIDDATLVHDLRKALKHWRAMMRLIGPVVGDEAEALRVEARDVARQIAAARDGRAAQEAFSDLLGKKNKKKNGGGARRGGSLSEAARAAIDDRLARLRAGAEATGITAAGRASASALWKRAGAAVDRWPLARFDRDAAARQLGAQYRRARKAIPEDWPAASADALHTLRQRVVEHRYQMEIAETLWPKVMQAWVLEAQRLRDRLGAHHDLAVLEQLTGPGQPLSRWRSQLAPLIAARQAAHVAGARRLAGRLFAETPKAFLARMAALWEQRDREEANKKHDLPVPPDLRPKKSRPIRTLGP